MHQRFSFLMIVAALVAMTLPAAAHHRWGGQGDEEFQLSGTLAAPVSLAGPHGTMKVKDQAGQVWEAALCKQLNRAVDYHIDGEPKGRAAEFNVRIVPACINVIVATDAGKI